MINAGIVHAMAEVADGFGLQTDVSHTDFRGAVGFIQSDDAYTLIRYWESDGQLVVLEYSNDDRGGAKTKLELSDPELINKFELLILEAQENHEAFMRHVSELRTN